MKKESIKKVVKEEYTKVASRSTSSCCSSFSTNCCGQKDLTKEISSNIGYSKEDLEKVPNGSNLGLGCGNPIASAYIKRGEIVLDLGSGAGFDCFLASDKVGPSGKVIGVDMTPEMIDRARQNAKESGFKNVEFRLGEIENLPVADNTIDIIISNCVINLSPDKERVFKEAFRVLKHGGRILISDIVSTKELPSSIKNSPKAYVGCIAGAVIKDEYLSIIKKAGFVDVKVLNKAIFPIDYIISDNTDKIIKSNLNLTEDEIEDLNKSILSIKISARKL